MEPLIIAALVGLVPVMPEGDEIYAYAIGILIGTVVQFLLPLPWLRGRGGRLTVADQTRATIASGAWVETSVPTIALITRLR